MNRKKIRKWIKVQKREGRPPRPFVAPPASSPDGAGIYAARMQAERILRVRSIGGLPPARLSKMIDARRRAPDNIAVRWIGAYRGGRRDTFALILEAVRFEMNDKREKAFAIQQRTTPPLGDALVGLIVDLSRSRVSHVFSTNVYSVENGDGALIATESAPLTSIEIELKRRERHDYHYAECFGVLKFSALAVIANAPVAVKRAARKAARETGLKFVTWL